VEIYPVDTLSEREFGVNFINALAQYWRTTRSFQCIGLPKKQHLLLYLDGCSISYTDKSGRRISAGSGDVVYTPVGSEYRAVLSDFRDNCSHTVGINFSLYGDAGEEIALSDKILVFRQAEVPSAPILFRRALSVSERSPLERRILMLEILNSLCSHPRASVPSVIQPALRRLSEATGAIPTVASLAYECHISEVYFRRIFKESMGEAPAVYCKRLRLERARDYLTYGDISVGEISELLGYASVSHFIKEFGLAYGASPLRYRKMTSEQ